MTRKSEYPWLPPTKAVGPRRDACLLPVTFRITSRFHGPQWNSGPARFKRWNMALPKYKGSRRLRDATKTVFVMRSVLLIALALPGCGAGTAGLISAARNQDDSGNAPTTIGDVFLEDGDRASPGTIVFFLTDEESVACDVKIVLNPGIQGSEEVIAEQRSVRTAPDNGRRNTFVWDYQVRLGNCRSSVPLSHGVVPPFTAGLG
ncbi:MAG: hypothetical protein AB1486_16190 [Planctomycetota bacterium]